MKPSFFAESLGSRVSDLGRQCALLRSNEKILSRRFRSVRESEASLRRERRRRRREAAEAEGAFAEKVGALQR